MWGVFREARHAINDLSTRNYEPAAPWVNLPAVFESIPKRYVPLKSLDYQAAQEEFEDHAVELKEGIVAYGRVAIIASFNSGQLTHILTTLVPGGYDWWIRVSKQPLDVKLAAVIKWADGSTLSKKDLLANDDRDSDDSEE